jgi:acyl transferase domain-containing protein
MNQDRAANAGVKQGSAWQGQSAAMPPVAIVGLAALFPGESGTTGFWRTIARGEDTITEVPAHYWRIEDYYDADPSAPDKTYCKRGGFLKNVAFDTLRFGLPPAAMTATDTAQLLALIAASEVLDGIGRTQRTALDKKRTSVVLGVASATELCVHMGSRLQRPVWANALREHGLSDAEVTAICDRISDHFVPWQEASFPGLLGNVVAGRIANRLDLGGANFVTDAACASSLSALQVGLQQLYLGEADTVLAGGVDALNDILMFMCFSKTPAFSRSGDCRPFSDQADGTILGEGVAMFALRRLEDAERDGNEIYAVVRGLGAASDGRATSVYAPRLEGQALAIERAYAAAGYDPATVELIEAHGTGTKAGDAAEFGGLTRVFGPARPERRQWCALGSVKSQIGHSKAAAGSAGLFKAAMALHHRVMPPTLKVERPNPGLKIEESPFYLNTELRPWIRGRAHPRRASVSSFGFGGSNFHVALEEYVGPGRRAAKRRHHESELVLLSAASPAELDRALAETAARAAGTDLSQIASRTQSSFDAAQPCRAALPAGTAAQLEAGIAKAREALAKSAPGPLPGGGRLETQAAAPGRVALLFPGQGSQYVGMGGGLAAAFDAARRVWDKAADAVSVDGTALHEVVFPAPAFTAEARAAQEARLTRMAFAQPAIAVAEAAMLAVLDAVGLRAHCFAGHSFGEVMALHAAGAYGLDTALGVAAERGRLMTEAARSTEGAMLAVAAGHDTVAKLVAELGLDLVLANDNSPQQVVLSGSKAAIETAQAALKQRGLNVTALPVATGFHSPIVAGSVEPFHRFLASQGLVGPGRTVYANSSAAPYPADAGGTEEMLARQLGQAVRFRETIERMYADGVRTFVEVGPGSVLTNLVKQCLGDRPHRAIALDRKGAKGLAGFWQGIGELALAGLPLNLAALWQEAPAEPETRRPTGAHVFEISGVNVGKPYPQRAAAAAAAPARPAAPRPAPAVPAMAGRPAVPAAAAPAMATSSEALLAGFQSRLEEQQKRLETALLDAHRAYLETSKAAFLAVFGGAGGEARTIPVINAEPSAAPAPEPVAAWRNGRDHETAPVAAPAPTPVPVAVEIPVAPAPVADGALLQLVQAVVAEKTGYPPEVLGVEMDLEAELGIDSIKQVEILSALREKLPGLPELDPAALARYRTIRMIAELLGGGSAAPAPAPAAAAPVAPAAPAAAAPTPAQPAADDGALLRLVQSVVAEKTGYPAEVLGADMDLEAELGIDSIKQVEILSALREKLPGLPELDPAALARYRTIRMIAELLGGGSAAPAPVAAPVASPVAAAPVPVAPAPAPAQPTADSGALLPLVQSVVAEKTGYPAEVLGADMDLEAELGIDSIKQVEILSALRERLPGLPELDPAALARYRTIRMIAELLGGAAAAPAPVAAPAPAPAAAAPVAPAAPAAAAPAPAQPASDDGALLRLVQSVVAEKTGYPAEVLGADMDLEAELGIDSIKQVEILSALRERLPGLPELDPAAVARYRTIAMIAAMLGEAGGAASADAPEVAARNPFPGSSSSWSSERRRA